MVFDSKTCINVQDKADRQNQIFKEVIGGMESTTKAFIKIMSSGVANAILCTADVKNFNSINNYELREIMVAVIMGINRPEITGILR